MMSMDYDVLIIGAGPGGIFTAYELTEKAWAIIADLKNRYINEKLKTQNIVLKYLNGSEF